MYDDDELGQVTPTAARGAARFLTDLADVARTTGRPVVELNGWRTRTRGGDPNGYAAGRPNHVMIHHTAESPVMDGRSSAEYQAFRSSTAPIANLYVDRTGTVWVMAAGPTNTNGRGSTSSRDGTAAWDGAGVADNTMNSHAIGVELANNGVGELWTRPLVETAVELTRALQAAYGIPTDRVRGHHEWTRRKIDPAGPSPWATGRSSWNMNLFRADLGTTPPPPTPDEGEPMLYVTNAGTGAIWVGDGITRRHVADEEEWNALRWVTARDGRPLRDWITGNANPDLGAVAHANPAQLAALGRPV
jgi:N-acetylmuramoyl-L-alanine amidase